MKRLPAILAVILIASACSMETKNTPLAPSAPSMLVIPNSITLSVGQSQVFKTSEPHVDIIFQLSSDSGDWHRFVKATGQSYDAIQLTGIQPTTGDKRVYLNASANGKSATAIIKVVP